MKQKTVLKLPKPRKNISVRFKSGAGSHQRSKKAIRSNYKIAVKKGQEVFQSVS